jgi:two-component system chemotaxis response regulator CheY
MKVLNILILDDSKMMRGFIRKTLLKTDLHLGTVHMAASAKEAFDIISYESVDVCFVDWNMPEMNGLEFVVEIRKSQTASRFKIIMLTTEASPSRVNAANAAGVNGYVLKPFDSEKLETTIRSIFSKYEQI